MLETLCVCYRLYLALIDQITQKGLFVVCLVINFKSMWVKVFDVYHWEECYEAWNKIVEFKVAARVQLKRLYKYFVY